MKNLVVRSLMSAGVFVTSVSSLGAMKPEWPPSPERIQQEMGKSYVKAGIQEMQQEVACEIWGASKPLAQQEITQIIEHKIDTPEFRGLKLCLRAAMGPVSADEWFADLPEKILRINVGDGMVFTDKQHEEMQALVDELRADESDIVVLVIGGAGAVWQIAPRFIFDNFARQFVNKKAKIILVDPDYIKDEWKKEIAALAEKLKKYLGIDEVSKIIISGNSIRFDQKTDYSNVEMKCFGGMIPMDPSYHNLCDYIRRFVEKKAVQGKNIFIAWMPDLYRNCISLGLSDIYLTFKDRYPNNIFFYCSAVPWEDRCDQFGKELDFPNKEKFKFLIYDPLVQFNLKPLSKRLFTSVRLYQYDLFKKNNPCLVVKFSKVIKIRRPFLICKNLNFIFTKKEDGSLAVSLNDRYASKREIESFWKEYISSFERLMVWNKGNGFENLQIQDPSTWREAVEQSGFMSWDEYQKVVPN